MTDGFDPGGRKGNLGASKDFTNYNNFVGRRKLEGKSGAREKEFELRVAIWSFLKLFARN